MAQTLSQLFNVIETKNNITLTNAEKQDIVKRIKEIDKSQYENYNADTTFRILAKLFNNYIMEQRGKQQPHKEPYTNDIDDIMDVSDVNNSVNDVNDLNNMDDFNAYIKDDMIARPHTIQRVHSVFGMTNPRELAKMFNPDISIKKAYIVADTKFCIQIVPVPGVRTSFTWTYTYDTNIREGVINSVNDIRNIKSIKLYRLRLPYLTEVVNTVNRRFTVLIREFAAQSFLNYDGTRFHFVMNPILPSAVDGSKYNCNVFDYNEGVFIFDQPITTLQSITLIVQSDMVPINFLHDRDTCTFTYGATTTITTTNAIGLVSATMFITITGFNTNAPSADASTIAAVNSLTPILATITGANTCTIAINTAAITPTVGLTANIYYEDRRVIFPFEVSYLEE